MVTSIDLRKSNTRRAAQLEVEGFILHDQGNYRLGGEKFGHSYHAVDRYRETPVGLDRCLEAGLNKMAVLIAYDRIIYSNPPSFIDESIISHPEFGNMGTFALREARELGVPPEYGRFTVQWYLEHAEWMRGLAGKEHLPQDDYPFLEGLKIARKHFDIGMVGKLDDATSERSWRLYLKCVLAHDHRRVFGLNDHSPEMIREMEENYQAYLDNLFEHGSK